MPSRKMTWRVRYRTAGGRNGQVKTFTIGDAASIKLSEAITKAREIKAVVQLEGRDPQAEKAGGGTSFDSLFTDWLDKHSKPKKKSWRHDEELYIRHVQSRLGSKTASELKRADIAAVLDDIAKKVTGIQANRSQALISAVLNWAVNEGRIEHSPVYRLPKRALEKARDRVLSQDEIRKFWKGLLESNIGFEIATILQLALLTGQRRTEIVEARQSEFDLSESDPSWTIPAERTKNSVLHRVPLTPAVVKRVKKAMEDNNTDFLFPGRDSDDAAITPHAVTRAMARLTAELDIDNATVHDLRRTVGTSLARLGISKDIRARILNHVDGARSVTDAVYNQHEFTKEKRQALELWEHELIRIVKER